MNRKRAARSICLVLICSFAIGLARSAEAQAMEKKTVTIVMPDGVGLASDVYLPKSKTRMPALLIRTPYGKDEIGEMILPLFAGKKYALVVQDVRGRGASEGVSVAFLDAPSDGFETVEWIARQPWSDGRVATAGISALGINQYLMHKKPSPHLACQTVMAAPESLYHTIAYQGGSVRRALFYGWIMNGKFPIDTLKLVLAHPDYDDLWRQLDLVPDYGKVDVPILHMAGWYDLYLQGNLNAFEGIRREGGPKARDRQRLVIGPWIHENFLGIRGTKQVELDYPRNSVWPLTNLIGWLEECVEGKDRGFLSGPAVRYYVMGDVDDPAAPGNAWRDAESWPPPHEPTTHYFHANGLLSPDPPAAAGERSFTDDPARPVPTLGSREHGEERHPVDLRPIESRDDVLVFSTPVLDRSVETTGPITAKIYYETDVSDVDFHVRLSDVYPDGRSMLVTDGVQRASHQESDRYRTELTPGTVHEMEVKLWPTSLVFNKGHRIRVSVSGTNFPRFDVNHHNGRYHNLRPGELEKALETGVEDYVFTPDVEEDDRIAHTTVHLSGDRPSSVTLPLAPN